MIDQCGNIYKSARADAGFTQKQAAEKLFVSERSIADYESGRTIPCDDVVNKMIEIYDNEKLAWLHLVTNTSVGRDYLPMIEFLSLSEAVLTLEKEMDDVLKRWRSIISIAMNGRVGRGEEEAWGLLKEEIMDLAAAALAVIFAK